MSMYYRSNGPVEIEFVGGPQDGARMVIPALTTVLELPIVTGDLFADETRPATMTYRLDPGCLDERDHLVTNVARYQLQPPQQHLAA